MCRLGAAALAKAYRSKELSPVEVTKACLARAEAINPTFNAFTFIDAEGALKAAHAAEQRWVKGEPICDADGLPTTLKDIVSVKDWPVTFGSAIAAKTPCTVDAPAVERLRQAGAVFIAQTTTPELGWKAVTDSRAFGVTRNPYDASKTAGGSSGGAAVAAATGAGVFHLGTDGGGSIRVPSAFCGISGLKPTFTRVPAYPASAFGTVAHLGPMTRSADDSFAMLKVMSGRDRRDWYQGEGALPALERGSISLKGLRVGYWTKPPAGQLAPQVKHIVDQQIGQLEAAGVAIEPFDLPGDHLLDLFHHHWFAGAAARLAQIDPRHHADIDPGFIDIARQGASIDVASYVAAQGARAEFGAKMDQALGEYDFLLSPATTIPAFGAGLEVPEGSGLTRWTQWASFSFPINLSQQPAGVVPCGATDSGLPIAVQIVGARGADARVLSMMAVLEEMWAGALCADGLSFAHVVDSR